MTRLLTALILLMTQLIAYPAMAQRTMALAATAAKPTMGPVYLHWLRVDPQRPATLYLGGALTCDDCGPSLVMRSTDAGASWADFGDGLGLHDAPLGLNRPCEHTTTPLVLGASGHLYTEVDENCGSPHQGIITSLAMSLNGGARWFHTQGHYDGPDTGSTDYGHPTISPIASDSTRPSNTRVYALRNATVLHSDDAGAHFKAGGKLTPDDSLYPVDLVASNTKIDTVYATARRLANPDTYSWTLSALRSDDAGLTWTPVITPTATLALQGFRVGVDTHEPGLLVGYSTGVITGTGVMVGPLPALTDTRYLSADDGRTWRQATCPGDVEGTCPRFTLDNLFGAGHAYAIAADGIHAFSGGSPSGPRLGISDQLPVTPAAILDIGGGTTYGDPIYLLAQGTAGQVHGLLYRSDDGGKSWQHLRAGVLPNAQPPSIAPGALLVQATRHTVAPAFVSTYRRLGLDIIGYPLTEAFLEGDVLTQVFQRLELQRTGDRVTFGHLGRVLYDARNDVGQFGVDYPSGDQSTGFYLRHGQRADMPNDIARYYRDHGGQTIFGRPISAVFTDNNGDGSTRSYAMQLFDNVRIERHPESKGARYALQLGLVGAEALSIWGWQ